ncbi:MAG TPA: hypothetical protein VKA76_03335 [Gammaproteobacteria bacterium]|nr:hypothetical protein [Gammaproteobacteria bacterium]
MDTVLIHGKPVELRISAAARNRLADRPTPLLAEMELYFSCLVRKRVRFQDLDGRDGTVNALQGLNVCFRPVTTAECRMVDAGEEVPTTAMPVVNPAAFVPHWLTIDYRRGGWLGEFGYQRSD